MITLLCFSYTRALPYYKKTLEILQEQDIFKHFSDKILSIKVLDNNEAAADQIITDFSTHGFSSYKRYLSTNPTNTLEYQNEYLLDIIAASKHPLILKNPYVFWFESDSPFKSFVPFEQLLNKATEAFQKVDLGRIDTVQYRFLRETSDVTLPRHKNFLVEKDFNFQPMIISTDYFIHCCKVLETNWDHLKNYQCEMAFRICADAISPFAYKYKVFLPEEGLAYHLDGGNI